MKAKKKILTVLKKIKEKSEINPDKKQIKFRCDDLVLTNTDIVNIIIKLQAEGIVKLHIPESHNDSDEYKAAISQSTPEEFFAEQKFILVELLQGFNFYYYKEWLKSFDAIIYYTNPFWVLLSLVKNFFSFIKYLWNKNKFIFSVVSLLATFLVYDWSRAWNNLNIFFNFIKDIIKYIL